MTETPAEKFLREREEKRKKREKRDERRKAKLLKPKDMSGAFPHTPGVYKLINKRNGKVYVSYSQKLSWGIQTHLYFLRKNQHANHDLQWDYNNGDRFDVVILKEYTEYDEEVILKDVKEFIASENSFYDGYNRSRGANY